MLEQRREIRLTQPPKLMRLPPQKSPEVVATKENKGVDSDRPRPRDTRKGRDDGDKPQLKDKGKGWVKTPEEACP